MNKSATELVVGDVFTLEDGTLVIVSQKARRDTSRAVRAKGIVRYSVALLEHNAGSGNYRHATLYEGDTVTVTGNDADRFNYRRRR